VLSDDRCGGWKRSEKFVVAWAGVCPFASFILGGVGDDMVQVLCVCGFALIVTR
jgi:hypothetical protein